MIYRLWIPTLLMGIYLPLSPEWDLVVERLFYCRGNFSSLWIWRALYQYGTLLPVLSGCGAFALLCLDFRWPKRAAVRKGALLYLAVLVLGSGALIHLVLKEIWSRPRPVQTEEFGGFVPFRPLYHPKGFVTFPLRSFPSGHVGAGASFLAFICIGKREKRRDLQWAGFILSAISGGSLAAARMAQGGHFLSDVLGTTYLMWCFCILMEQVLYGKSAQCLDQPKTSKRFSQIER